jgi:hypothetical protein
VKPALLERLVFLIRVVEKEIRHLSYSSDQVFSEPFTVERACTLLTNEDFAQQVEAFTSRFCRLQDTVGDKLIPTWLKLLGEPIGAVIDNLDKAEKLGVLVSVDIWLEIRQTRNQMIHEYIESLEILTTAINLAYQQQTQIIDCAKNIISNCRQRKLIV